MNQWRKDIVKWKAGSTLYLSVPFTWMLDEAAEIAESHRGEVIAGGPAIDLMGAPWADETPGECPYDVLSMHNPCATFTTRGCPNACSFCAVPKIEGDFREFQSWKPAPLVCDNNLLASTHRHFERVVDSLLPFQVVDFNQGLDARLFTRWHAGQIARLKKVKVRFAFDHVNNETAVHDAIVLAKKAGLKDLSCYVLLGFHDTPGDARYRLEFLWARKVWPFPMRYQPLDAREKNEYVGEGWDEAELKRMTRYYSRLRYTQKVPYDEFEMKGWKQRAKSKRVVRREPV